MKHVVFEIEVRDPAMAELLDAFFKVQPEAFLVYHRYEEEVDETELEKRIDRPLEEFDARHFFSEDEIKKRHPRWKQSSLKYGEGLDG